MKKIHKSSGPNALTRYAEANPGDGWDDFRNAGSAYTEIKQQVFQEQGGLCAYCETLPKPGANHQRLEHFHPKSDQSDPEKNWALDWDNIIGVCHGGADSDNNCWERPANLSCDAHKDHMINRKNLPPDCNGWLLNPLYLPRVPCLFEFDLRTYELKPDRAQCAQLVLAEGKDTVELVNRTIAYLNLNCDRLKAQRKEILFEYNRQEVSARKRGEGSKDFRRKLVARWFRTPWPSFFTTRRILLGAAAEAFLQNLEF